MTNKIKGKKSQLGRGLSSLLGDDSRISQIVTSQPNFNLKKIPIELISPGPWQARKIFDKEELMKLSKSIKDNDLIQPIVVTPNKNKKGSFLIIAGERRWRASQLAQIHEVTAIIKEDITLDKIVEISLIENLQRKDLNPIEEATGYKNLIDNHNYSQSQLASSIGKSRPYITNIMRLLTLPNKIQDYLIKNKLTVGHARALIGQKDSLILAEIIIKKNLSVRSVEKLIYKETIQKPENDPELKNIEKKLENLTGLKVKIKFNNKNKNGNIVFYYKGLDQFDNFLKLLK